MTRGTRAADIHDQMVKLRREFHRHPELSFHEVQTARRVCDELDRLGIPWEYGGEGTGVVGRLHVSDDRPTVAIRAEMDALPGHEETGLPFASREPGKMHACGHDAHMAMVLGAASMLKASPPDGNVLFVFQPAEERGGGSRVVIDSGILDEIRAIFAVHVTHHYDVGQIMVADGTITAQSDRFQIRISGRGGHGARPHEAIDAVVVAGAFINSVQTLVSREVNPFHPSVVTIGRMEAGSAPNVIAGEAVLEGSIRTTRPDVREHIHTGLKRMGSALAELHSARIEVEISAGYPPVINDPQATAVARRAAADVVGETNVTMHEHPSMGSEDFAFYLQKFPGSYVRLGARLPDQEYIPLHSPRFDLDERAMAIGASYFDQVVRRGLTELDNEG
jgi:hippurate hydrolase